ncbi:hypothetical protein K491DRAFT_698080 [Lophiostoma macrostomum CBS 122681]|uniref:Uncharacterized protein n=1 Tax=Lophiostoma macrostomum CBS 122681 TaxID=1314788 RepID=A0A6A6SNL7_9PLEO|nr:hypothetical protein K491DRAFT_698080 [Lophiostoma macrostomum CBS 122681]
MPKYPGLGLELRHNPQDDYGFYPIGAHGSCYASESELLPIRELAMMSIMDKLTDKEDWQKKVFDEAIVAKWRKEALEIPDQEFVKLATSDKYQYWDVNGYVTTREDNVYNSDPRGLEGVMDADTFNVCVQELQAKAKHFEMTGLIPTLDACASVAKSDSLVAPELQASLRAAFSKVREDQASSPDWHPNTGDVVQDLVHPSMYPLVYGRSRVLTEELVGVSDSIEKWAGKGDIVKKDTWAYNQDRDRYSYGVGGGKVPPQYWSNTYQWLPANVAFQENGTVKFTSYVNNLHPLKFPDIYRTIEKLIETALPAWDQCLALGLSYREKEGAGRVESRFSVFGGEADDENPDNWIPGGSEDVNDDDVDPERLKNEISDQGYDPDDPEECDEETVKEIKWKMVRKPRIPGVSFEDIDYAPADGKRLVDKYRETGLQVIVKMASIELTPEKPEFPVGGWHVEGQMNEHICGTALYYLDSENVTSSSLSFRMQTSAYMNDDIDIGQDSYHWLENVCGTNLGGGGSPCLQNYGSVETHQGRLLAFPNVFQHRVSPFHLIDPTKPGHRRFIALWLVDPNTRIISTANVPPQQQSWWVDSVFGKTDKSRSEAMSKLPPEIVALLQEKGSDPSLSSTVEGKLPPELMAMIQKHFNADGNMLPMTAEEAKEHRVKLMQERSAFVKTAEGGWQDHSYSFCEH